MTDIDPIYARVYEHLNHMMNEVCNLSNIRSTQLKKVIIMFRKHPRVVFCSMGKPAFAVNKVVHTAQSFGLNWLNLDVTHAFHGDAGIIRRGDLLICVSKSGETAESVEVAEYFKDWDTIAVTSTEENSLADMCDEHLYIPITSEGSPFEHPPMASTTLYMIVLHAILCDIVEYSDCTLNQYAFNHPSGKIGSDLSKEMHK